MLARQSQHTEALSAGGKDFGRRRNSTNAIQMPGELLKRIERQRREEMDSSTPRRSARTQQRTRNDPPSVKETDDEYLRGE